MQFDLIAMGGGFSGLVTAARAAQLGLRAAVFEMEREDRYHCNSRYSSGVANVLGHHMELPAEELAALMTRASAGHAKPDLIEVFAANAGRTLAWLREEGLRFIDMYPTSKDRRCAVLAPPRRFKSGLDWEGRGADVSMRQLEKNLVGRGGAVMRGTRVTNLIMEGGACVGVEAVRDGKSEPHEAHAVVIADGGFMGNPDMIAKYITPHADKLNIRSVPQVRGEGMRMAEAAGAAMIGLGEFYGHLQHRDALTNPKLWPYPTFDALAQAAIVVGPDGKRLGDEGRGGVVMTNIVAKSDDPLAATIVFDEAMWTGEPGTAGPVAVNPFLAEGGGWMHSADDLAGLAAKAEIDAGGLAATVAAYNDAIATGTLDALDPPRTTRVFAAHAIATPPYHAVPLCAGITGTMGGLDIDGHARVLREDGAPIDGLYAVGTTTGGLEGGVNAAYIGGLSKAFVWGVLAAEHAAEYARQRESAG